MLPGRCTMYMQTLHAYRQTVSVVIFMWSTGSVLLGGGWQVYMTCASNGS